jgi:hypothetical protein
MMMFKIRHGIWYWLCSKKIFFAISFIEAYVLSLSSWCATCSRPVSSGIRPSAPARLWRLQRSCPEFICQSNRRNFKNLLHIVGTHLYNVKQKLGVANQAELTLIAVRHGLIEL